MVFKRVEKLWTQNTRIIHDVWRLLILSNEEKRTIMKILKKEWFIWKFWKRGVVEKRGEEETKSMPHAPVVPTSSTTFRGILICVIFRPGICKNIFLCSVLHWRIIRIKQLFSGVHACVHGSDALTNFTSRTFIQFMGASAPCTHAWTHEKKRLIL